jgi:hypothetical protein
MGIEPTWSAWKAEVLPLNYTRLQLKNHLTGDGIAVKDNFKMPGWPVCPRVFLAVPPRSSPSMTPSLQDSGLAFYLFKHGIAECETITQTAW